ERYAVAVDFGQATHLVEDLGQPGRGRVGAFHADVAEFRHRGRHALVRDEAAVILVDAPFAGAGAAFGSRAGHEHHGRLRSLGVGETVEAVSVGRAWRVRGVRDG